MTPEDEDEPQSPPPLKIRPRVSPNQKAFTNALELRKELEDDDEDGPGLPPVPDVIYRSPNLVPLASMIAGGIVEAPGLTLSEINQTITFSEISQKRYYCPEYPPTFTAESPIFIPPDTEEDMGASAGASAGAGAIADHNVIITHPMKKSRSTHYYKDGRMVIGKFTIEHGCMTPRI